MEKTLLVPKSIRSDKPPVDTQGKEEPDFTGKYTSTQVNK